MLSHIQLNHGGSRRFEHTWSYALLVVGMIVSISVFTSINNLRLKNLALMNDIDRLKQPESTNLKFTILDQAGKQEEISAVKTVMEELSIPWETLFSTLENLNVSKVKLVAIEPNLKQRKLRLTAEVADTDNMLRYMEAMARQPIFKEVMLITHEYAENSLMPIHFVVEARWVL